MEINPQFGISRNSDVNSLTNFKKLMTSFVTSNLKMLLRNKNIANFHIRKLKWFMVHLKILHYLTLVKEVKIRK